MLISFNLTPIEILALLAGAAVLGFAIYFFISSRRFLKQFLPQDPRKSSPPAASPTQLSSPVSPLSSPVAANTLASQPEKTREKTKDSGSFEEKAQQYKQTGWTVYGSEPSREEGGEDLVHTLKSAISQQQKALTGLLKEIEQTQDRGKKQAESENQRLRDTILALEEKLAQKEAEYATLSDQASMAEEMNQRIEEIYEEFRQMQKKMSGMEQQAARANVLEMELEEVRDAYERIHKDMSRKQEKLEEALSEGQLMRHQLHETEDKLAEANRQRQQLQKKVQFLQDMNEDLHQMSDTNKKLQNELRRIGELESMLHMISAERDQLLRKKTDGRSGL